MMIGIPKRNAAKNIQAVEESIESLNLSKPKIVGIAHTIGIINSVRSLFVDSYILRCIKTVASPTNIIIIAMCYPRYSSLLLAFVFVGFYIGFSSIIFAERAGRVPLHDTGGKHILSVGADSRWRRRISTRHNGAFFPYSYPVAAGASPRPTTKYTENTTFIQKYISFCG